MATQPQVTSGGPRQLVLVAALVAVLLLVLGLLVVRPMLAGESAEPAAGPPPATTGAAPAAAPQLIGPSTSVGPDTGTAAAASVKDPFRPLVDPQAAASATTVSGVPPGATTSEATSEATTPGGGATAERKVTLLGIDDGTARVSVDGRAYTVEEGESFASDYRAVDIGSECASFESGTTPFTLCEGEAVLK